MKRALLIPALLISAACCSDPWPHQAFTPDAWKALPWKERYVLYESLAASKLLDGATRERVIELLGPPDGKNKPGNIAYLVRKRPLGFLNVHEVRVLDIRLGPDGKVARYFIRGT
jgi:hypothetical protein